MTTPTSLPNFNAPQLDRRGLVTAALTNMGVQPTPDDDGDLQIVVNDQQLYVRVTDDGPGLLRVFGQWRIMADLPGDDSVKFGVAQQVTATHALVKVNVFKVLDQPEEPGHLVVAIDQLVPEGTRYDIVLPALIDAVLSGVGTWHNLLIEHTGGGSGAAPA